MVLPGVGSSKCLVGYLPRSKQGSIIFTTHNRKVTTNGYVQYMVEVPNILDEGFCDAGTNWDNYQQCNCEDMDYFIQADAL